MFKKIKIKRYESSTIISDLLGEKQPGKKNQGSFCPYMMRPSSSRQT